MIRKGQEVYIKPEFQDAGDDKFSWIVADDEQNGRVAIVPMGTGLAIPPRHVVKVEWLAA